MKLERWHLEKGVCVLAWGIVYGHDRLADGTFIHTSPVVSIKLDIGNKRLKVRTRSGSLYSLALEDMDIQPIPYGNTEDSLKLFDISTDFMSEVKILVRAKQHKDLVAVDSLIADGDLLLEVSDANVVKAYFKQRGKVHSLSIDYHAGMFQDSVLIRKSGVVDYRYFPNLFSMRTYHISDGVKRLVIKNVGSSNVTLDDRVYEVGSVTYVCVTGYSYSEGLFSPDCVNGKSALFI